MMPEWNEKRQKRLLATIRVGLPYEHLEDDIAAALEEIERLDLSAKGWEETAHTNAVSRGCQEQMTDRAKKRIKELETVGEEIVTAIMKRKPEMKDRISVLDVARVIDVWVEHIKELEAQVLGLHLVLRDSVQERATIIPLLSSEDKPRGMNETMRDNFKELETDRDEKEGR